MTSFPLHFRTQVSIEDQGFEFPDITICDPFSQELNPDFISLKKDLNLSEISRIYERYRRAPVRYTPGSFLAQEFVLFRKVVSAVVRAIFEHTDGSWRTHLSLDSLTKFSEEHFINFTRQYPWSQDRVIYCRYYNKTCFSHNFTTIFTHRDKNCHTFKVNSKALRAVNGSDAARKMQLYLLILIPSVNDTSTWAKPTVSQ